MTMAVQWRLWTIAVIVGVLTTNAGAGTISEIFVFGDSLSDTGNVLNRTNAISALADPRPTVPWYDTGRWTNGTSNDGSNTTPPRTKETAFGGVWHERLADKLNIGRATNSLAGGNNWAYGGAITGTGTFSSLLALQNVRTQVDTFLAGTPTFNDQQLYAVWGGGNDVRDAANAANATVNTIKAAATTALANMKASIAALAGAGGEKFLWPNLPPLEKTPEAAGLTAVQKDGLKQASELFRDEQAAAVTMLLNSYFNIEIFVLDVHGKFLEIAANPGNFGYIDVTSDIITADDFSAGTFTVTANFPTTQIDADKYLFWDQVHPTARTHDLIGMEAFTIVPEPSVFVMVGSLLLVFIARRLTGGMTPCANRQM